MIKYTRNNQSVILLLFGSKGFRIWAIILSFFLVHEISVLTFSYYLSLFSSILFVIYEKPWKYIGQLKASQWKKVALFSLLHTLIVLLWNNGLKYIGPLGTVLFTDYTFETYPILLNNIVTGNLFGNDIGRACLMLLIGYLTIPVFGGAYLNQYINTNQVSLSQIYFIGAVCLIIHNVLIFFRQGMLFKWQHNVSSGIGKNKLYALGMVCSTFLLFIFKIFDYVSSTTSDPSSSPNTYQFIQILFISIFSIFINYNVEAVTEQQLGFLIFSKASLTSSFIFSIILGGFSGLVGYFSPVLFVSFILILTGIHILFSKENVDQHQLLGGFGGFMAGSDDMDNKKSMMNRGSGGNDLSTFSGIMTDVIQQIVSKPTSRRIFTFLIINLMFMFVEMFYGIWTNSLGLITDACHMLFDATALFIALFAEVISNWSANETYSYGYGRVKILSGFVNGIFLIFISITILMESIERLMEPPEVKTDKLLLVSVLGFLVNMVGVFSFHEGHGHSHGGSGGDHGHSHGHSHGGYTDNNHNEPQQQKRSVNIDGVFLHLLADTLGSVGVIISSLIIQFWGYTLADPICSLCISILIFLSVIPLIKDTSKTLLQCTPESIKNNVYRITESISNIKGVLKYEDYHFWSHNEDDLTIGTIKVHVEASSNERKIRKQIQSIFKENNITKTTIEIIKPDNYNQVQHNHNHEEDEEEDHNHDDHNHNHNHHDDHDHHGHSHDNNHHGHSHGHDNHNNHHGHSHGHDNHSNHHHDH